MPAARSRQGAGWRALGIFWLLVLALTGGLVGTLQVLGPPSAVTSAAVPPAPTAAAAPSAPSRVAGELAGPVQALLQASTAFPGAFLPRIGSDGRLSRIVYARPSPPAGRRPRVALLVTGLGMSASDSQSAIQTLPGPVSLAFTPYGDAMEPLESAARRAGHEMLVSIPMEPDGYPLTDAGTHSLLTGAPPAQNATNLEWTLGRLQAYVGATGALEGMRGERFAAQLSSMKMVLDELRRRGLLYVDPRPGPTSDFVAQVPGRTVDLVVDDPPARAEVEAKLAALERIAREKGSALGLAGPLRPVVIDRIGDWAKGLDARGIDLVPVSALINVSPGAQAGAPTPARTTEGAP